MSTIKKRIRAEIAKKKQNQKKLQHHLDKRIIVGYCRVSTDKQESDGYGLEYQISRIKDYTTRQNLTIEVIYQEAFTGKVNERKQFERLIKQIKAEKIKTLITYKLDRLGRSQLNVLNFVNLLKEHKVQLITLEPEIDYNTQAGQIILSNLTMFAELERDMIIERTESGRLQKFNQGSKCQGAILGYVHNKKKQQYDIIPDEARLVYHIFTTYLKQDMSLRMLAEKLNEQAYTTKRGKNFYHYTVYRVLTNRFYIGSIFYKGKESPGSHEPIISRVLFGKVLNKLERQDKRTL